MDNTTIKWSNNHVNWYKIIFVIQMKVIEAHHFAILPHHVAILPQILQVKSF